MGLLWGKRAAKAKAAAAVDAWIAGATAALPGAQVSGDSWTGPSFMRGLTASTYTVTTLGSRSHLSAVLTRLAPQIEALGQNDTLHLQIAESDAPGAPHSRLTIAGEKRDREWLQFLVRTHDALVSRMPEQSVLLGGLNGRCTVLEVAREDALPTPRLLISWWEEQQTAAAGDTPLSGLSLEIGGVYDNPEITYTVDPSGLFDVDGVELEQPAEPLPAAWPTSASARDVVVAMMKPTELAAQKMGTASSSGGDASATSARTARDMASSTETATVTVFLGGTRRASRAEINPAPTRPIALMPKARPYMEAESPIRFW